MDPKKVLKPLLVKLVDNGSITIKLGTPESRALIILVHGNIEQKKK